MLDHRSMKKNFQLRGNNNFLMNKLHPYHPHALTLQNETSQGGGACSSCRKFINNGTPKYTCSLCEYDLCETCYSNTYNVRCHDHLLVQSRVDNGWRCDGIMNGGCKSGITNYNQSRGMNRYRCDLCDFDLCDQCLNFHIIKVQENPFSKNLPLFKLPKTQESINNNMNEEVKYIHKLHQHPLVYNNTDNGWRCDGIKFGGCKRGITDFNQTQGVPRYRCTQCDFDLCDQCLNVKNSFSINSYGNVFTLISHPYHTHPLQYINLNKSWECKGENYGGCQYREGEKLCFRCDRCDFNLCWSCIEYIEKRKYLQTKLEMPNDTNTNTDTNMNTDTDINTDTDDKTCVICLDRPRTSILIHIRTGAGHNICCEECANELVKKKQPCPICRESIDHVVKLFS